MAVPAMLMDDEIVEFYRRSIESGGRMPSPNDLVKTYHMGFSRAKKLVWRIEQATATRTFDENGPDETARHTTTESGHIAEPSHTAERVPTDEAPPLDGAPSAVHSASAAAEAGADETAQPRSDAPAPEPDREAVREAPGHGMAGGAPDTRESTAVEDRTAPRTAGCAAEPTSVLEGGQSPGDTDRELPGDQDHSGRELIGPQNGTRPVSRQEPLDVSEQEVAEVGEVRTEGQSPETARRGSTEEPPSVNRTEHDRASASTVVEVGASGDVEPVQTGAGAEVKGSAPGQVGAGASGAGAPVTAAPVRVRPSALTVVLWSVGAAAVAAVAVRMVQTPIGGRMWGWLTGVVGADALVVTVVAAGTGALVGAVGVVLNRLAWHRAGRTATPRASTAWSPRMYLAAALVFMGLSVDTSLRFFHDKVGITAWWELALVFSGMEVAMLACGVAMYEAVRAGRAVPTSATTVAWGIASLAGMTGLLLGGWPGGLVRAAGPALAMVMLHMAMGIERQRGPRPEAVGALARTVAELRERALSWLGLSDEGRSAVVRSRRRAARQAARLSLQGPGVTEGENGRKRSKKLETWQRELQRELAKADIARDAEARRVFLDEVAILRALSNPDELVNAVIKLEQSGA